MDRPQVKLSRFLRCGVVGRFGGWFGFDFNLVESVAKHTDDFRLRDECAGVNALNDAEDGGALALLCQDDQHLALLFRVPSLAIEHGHAAAGQVDGRGYLVVAVGEDEELDRLAAAVHHVVKQQVGDNQCAIAVEQGADVAAGQEEAGGDDDEVAEHHHLSECHVLVLVDNGGDDIRAARRAVTQEDDAQADTPNGSTEDTRHESVALHNLWWVVGAQLVVDAWMLFGIPHHNFLDKTEEEGQHEHGIDGLHAEFPSQRFDGGNEQNDVDQQEGPLHGEACAIEDNGTGTSHAARCNLVGQLEAGESDGVAEQSEGYQGVVFELLQEVDFEFEGSGCHKSTI